MKFPKFLSPDGSSYESKEIHGIEMSEYKLSFIEKNFLVTEADLRKMSEAEAKTLYYKASWILRSLRSRAFESVPPLYLAEEFFGVSSYDDFIAMPPEEFLGKNGLYEKVNRKAKDIEW